MRVMFVVWLGVAFAAGCKGSDKGDTASGGTDTSTGTGDSSTNDTGPGSDDTGQVGDDTGQVGDDTGPVGDDTGPGDTGTRTDEEIAEDLWEDIQGYGSWGQYSQRQGVFTSFDGTHGVTVQVWLNSLALTALEAGSDLPDDSIIVKEGYRDAAGTQLKSLTAMYKINGYNPDYGDWFWASFDPSTGEPRAAGKVGSCESCHAGYDTDGDYVVFDDVSAR